jgi:7-cyano-7-deazaguanine synthase in queuosine biosynthesis
MDNRPDHVLLLNSGGGDSYATAIILKKAGYKVSSLNINYGQPSWDFENLSSFDLMNTLYLHTRETAIYQATLSLASGFEEGATDYESQEIFLRNFTFIMYAAQLAYTKRIGNIALGYANMPNATVYLDDNPNLLQDINRMLRDYFGINLLTPLAGFNLDMVWGLLLDNGIDPATLPYCNFYRKEGRLYKPCGKCNKCELIQTKLPLFKKEREERLQHES